MRWKQKIMIIASILLTGALLWLGSRSITATPAAGTFTDTGQSLGNALTYDLAVGDLDNDSTLDVFAVSNTGIRAWLNDGTAVFSATQTFSTIPGTGVALGDLDGNNTLDAAVGSGSGAAIWLNDGSANFSDTGQLLGDSTSLLQAVALGDLDGDTDLDLFTASTQPNTVWLNDGAATFTDTGQSLGNLASNSVVLGDVDGDNDLDAVVANGWQFDNNQPSKLYINNGGGGFSNAQDLAVGWHYGAALGDLDGDNDLDIVLSNWEGAGSVWRNQGGAQGGTPGQFLAAGSVGSASGWRLDLADVDLDGDLDVVQAVNDGAGSGVWLNDGSGSFTKDNQVLSIFSYTAVLADFDADNDPDVMFGRFGDNEVWLNGDGTPEPTNTPTNTPIPTATPPTPMPAGASDWQLDVADSAGSAGFSPDIALDGNGRPHFTHIEKSSQTVNYTHWDGVRWYRDVVTDTNYTDAVTFIALDSQDQPHLLYQSGFTEFSYVRRSGDQWQSVVTFDGQTAADIILDNSDRLVAAYENDSNRLAVGRWLGSSWQTTQIDNRLLDGVQAAIVPGSGDELHLAYLVSSTSEEVIYGHFDGSRWTTETVIALDGFGSVNEIDLTLNDLGQPVILYTISDSINRLLRLTQNGAVWNEEQLFSNSAGFADPSLAYDSLGQEHVLFRLNGRPYYDDESGGWQFAALPGSETVQEMSELVLDGSDVPHFAFRDADYANLNYQFYGPAWEIHTLEASDSARLPAVSHVQSDVGVSFYSLNNEQLRFFQRQPGNWQDDPVADLTLPIVDNSLRLDLRGQHVISYRDSTNDRLMFGRFDGSAWQTEIVDDFGDVGYDNTLFVLPNGQLIVYWDADNFRVKVAHNDGSGWTLFADDVGPGLDSSSGYPRAILHNNQVYVTYYDNVRQDIRLATFDLNTPGWTDELLVGNGTAVSPYHAITRTGNGALAVAYHDETAGQIILGTRANTATTWDFELVANGIAMIRGLALEAKSYVYNNSLRLIYLDDSSNNVVMAAQIDGVWQFEAVRGGDNFLGEPSLGLGERPYLAYAAVGSSVLEFAVRVPVELERGVLYHPYNPGDNGDSRNFLLDVCAALLDEPEGAASFVPGTTQAWQPPVIGDDYDVYAAMTDVFLTTPGGQHYTDLYVQHLPEMLDVGGADPGLLWDSYHTLQDFMPGLEALVTGEGSRVIVTQRMVDNALDIWQRLAAAGSPSLSQTINDELAASNNLQDFVGMTFDEWALAIGVQPPAGDTLFLPVVVRE